MSSSSSLITVEVGAFASLRVYLPEVSLGRTKTLHIPAHSTLRDVLQLVNIPEDKVYLIMRNHQPAQWDDIAQPGDRIIFLPLIDGG